MYIIRSSETPRAQPQARSRERVRKLLKKKEAKRKQLIMVQLQLRDGLLLLKQLLRCTYAQTIQIVTVSFCMTHLNECC